MKKVILILSIIGTALFMTSCLGEVSSNYVDSTFVYVEFSDEMKMFGKTISPVSPSRLITNPDMLLLNPGSINVMTYSWDEANRHTTLNKGGESFYADNVQISGEIAEITKKTVNMNEMPEIEEPVSFLEVAPPLYADNKEFMGDLWIFQYAYEARKGEVAYVEFYKRDDASESGDKIIIDINLTMGGNPEGTTYERNVDALALNMSPIRNAYQGSSQTATKKLEIEFHYYLNNQPQPSQIYRLTVAE